MAEKEYNDGWIPCSERLPEEELEKAKKERGSEAVFPVLATINKNHIVTGEKYTTVSRACYGCYNDKNFYNACCDKLDVKSITRYKNGNFGNFDGVEYYIKKRKAIEIVKQEAEKFGTDINVVSNGWIPCSERLPEESGTYIVNAIENSIIHITFAKWMPRMKKWNLTGCRSYWKVNAWQPLPEPFKERD